MKAKTRDAIRVGIALAILSPLVRSVKWDSFPISSFPMFARGDVGSKLILGHVILVGVDGSRRPAPPELVGTPEPMVAKNVVERAIMRGASQELCGRIAARAGATTTSVEVVISTFDTQRYFHGDRAPTAREVYASCNVPR